ncbi:MAG: hypothetical protein ABR898_05630 [Terracidiphilus sp.]|jgi:hypothetical protein
MSGFSHFGGTAALIEAAWDPALRMPALLQLASEAPVESLPEVLALFCASPVEWPNSDAARYAFGLALWRCGERSRALRIWKKLPSDGSQAIEPAAIAHAAECLADGRLGECSAALEWPYVDSAPAAETLRRQLALAAQSKDEWLLAASISPPAGDEPALEGRINDLLSALEEVSGPGTSALRAILLAYRSAGRSLPSGSDCDWRILRNVCRNAPEVLHELAPGPQSADPWERVAYWAAREDFSKACHELRPVVAGDPWNPDLTHKFAVLSYLRATRAFPELDVAAWEDTIAHSTCFLENRDWLESWVKSRLTVYAPNETATGRGEGLKTEVTQIVDQELTSLLAAAHERGDTTRQLELNRLRALAERERRAAAAMWKAGDLLSASGSKLAFGPLYARNNQLDGRVQEYFEKHPEKEEPETDESLRALLAAIGLDESLIPGDLDESASDGGTGELRRWFSDLGEAASLEAAGDLAGAREASLTVYVRYTPPGEPSEDALRRANAGYATGANGAAKIRRSAARMLCELEIAALRIQLSSPAFDVATVGEKLKGTLSIAVALESESYARQRLVRLVLGKQKRLLEAENVESGQRACALLRAAREAGLNNLEPALTLGLHRCGMELARAERPQDAAACYEEAWALDKSRSYVVSNLVGSLLQAADAHKNANREDQAGVAMRRASELAAEAARLFPDDKEVQFLPTVVRMVEFGTPVGDLIEAKHSRAGKTPPPSLPEKSKEEIKSCRAALRSGDLTAALASAERARLACPEHPDTVAVEAHAALELARSKPETEGRALFDHAAAILSASLAFHQGNSRLEAVRIVAGRDRVLYHGDDFVAQLHRKALRLVLSGKPAMAAEPLRVASALEPAPGVELSLLLTEAMTAAALAEKDVKKARRDLAAAEAAMTAAIQAAPAHRSLPILRENLASAREAVTRRGR